MSIESVMPSNHLILYHPLLLLPSILPSIRVFSNESSVSSSINWGRSKWHWDIKYQYASFMAGNQSYLGAELWLKLGGFSFYPCGPFHSLLGFLIACLLDSKIKNPLCDLALGMHTVSSLPYSIDSQSKRFSQDQSDGTQTSFLDEVVASHFLKVHTVFKHYIIKYYNLVIHNFLKLYFIYGYYKMLAIFSMLYNIPL